MPKITEQLTIMGFAWLDENNEINWAVKEDIQDIPPNKRPEGCTPCVIEIIPSEEWTTRRQQDFDILGNVGSQLNVLSSELEQLQKALRVKG